MSGRKAAANSLEQQLKAAQVASTAAYHDWPDQIAIDPAGMLALEIYRAGQQSRAHEDWTPLDLVELARVSKIIVMVDAEQALYEQEGTLVAGGRRGTTLVENPRGRAISTMNGQINSSLRRLGITSMSVAQKRGIASRADAEREARNNLAPTHEGNSDADISLI